MKKYFFLLICLSFFFKINAQIRFEPGYIINNDDQKIDVFIKNIDWKNNPKKIEYKITENSKSIAADVNSLKEFSINNSHTYKKFKVNIDRSPDNIRNLSTDKNPLFSEEELPLKVIIDGDAILYYYQDENIRRYFFQVDNSDVEQLIYKSYISPDNKVEKNETYKQQLWLKLKCDKISIQDLEKTGYNNKDLKKIIHQFNNCNDEPIVEKKELENKKKKNPYHIAIRPGINISTMTLYHLEPYGNDFADFGSKTTFRLGIENEFTLPFHKDKWSIILEPTYRYYRSESEIVPLFLPQLIVKPIEKEAVKVEYESLEIPIGIRHYFFLNKNSRLYLNSQLVYDISYNSGFEFESGKRIEFKHSSNFVFGTGLKIRKFSLETRYNLTRNVINGRWGWGSKFKNLSFVFGYNIF